MRIMLFLLTLVTGLNLGAAIATADDGEMSMMEILTAEAERPGEPLVENRPDALDENGGVLLFTMIAPDHARCVRGVPDVNGDGLAR